MNLTVFMRKDFLMSLFLKKGFFHDDRCESDRNDKEILKEARAKMGRCLHRACGDDGQLWEQCFYDCNCKNRQRKATKVQRMLSIWQLKKLLGLGRAKAEAKAPQHFLDNPEYDPKVDEWFEELVVESGGQMVEQSIIDDKEAHAHS